MFFLFILVVGVIAVVVRRYNALQALAQGVREAHANLLAAMKKRIDLTNKLIDIAKGYADHEKLTHITVSSGGDDIAVGGTASAGALNQVMKLATQYPDLKANATFQQLMAQLDGIEGDLQVKREAYNAQVRNYNTALMRLPVSLYARHLGFRPAPYFDVENADALERIKDFHSEDAEHLKQLLSDGSRRLAEAGRRVADSGARLAGESMRVGRLALEKGIEKGSELHRRHVEGGDASGASPVSPDPHPPHGPPA